MKSRCQDCRLNSPSVTRLSSAGEISFLSACSRAATRAAGRIRLPTWSARKGGLVRSMPRILRTIIHRSKPGGHPMKAGVASENGLVVRDIPQPRPKPHEVLVKIKAAGLNRADLAVARGLPHGPHSGIGASVGIEWAGEVVEAGAQVQGGFKPG